MSLSQVDPRFDPGSNAPTADGKSNVEAYLDHNAAATAQTAKEQSITHNLTNGPVAQSVKAEASQTSNELDGLASSRQTPQHTAATGQSLTHYHSFFYTLFGWEHPRATAIAFASTVGFIFACRYLPVLKWTLKLTYMVLGFVTLAELAAKTVTGSSVTSSVRPRKYYKFPKETLEASLDDLEQLINFFVIESQRVVFAESIPTTALAFAAAFLSYYLIKILPLWGLSLVFTCVAYLGPFIYLQNKELIDDQLKQAGHVIGQQTQQVRDLTAEQANKSFENIKSYTSDYTAKASDYVGNARQKIPVPASGSGSSTGGTSTGGVSARAPSTSESLTGGKSTSGVSSSGASSGLSTSANVPSTIGIVQPADFPDAPATSFPSTAEHTKTTIYAPVTGNPIAASTT